MKKIFIDTAPYIYYIENSPQYFKIIKDFFINTSNNCDFYTSVISLAEFSVIPYRIGKLDDVFLLTDFLGATKTNIIQINETISLRSAKIRALYSGIKGMDALQLSSAIYEGCDTFLTNDKQLKQLKEINVVTVEDLLAKL